MDFQKQECLQVEVFLTCVGVVWIKAIVDRLTFRIMATGGFRQLVIGCSLQR